MKDRIKKMFNVNESIRLTLFNIITITVLFLGTPSILVMLVIKYGYEQIPPMVVALVTVVICVFIANKKKKLNLAASIIIFVCTIGLFPVIFFRGGGPNSGIILYFGLGIAFLFMLVDGAAFWCLLIIQILVYGACFYFAYIHPEWIIPLGDTKVVYEDIHLNIITVGFTIGVINKFQTRAYEEVIKTVNEKNAALKEAEIKANLANEAKSDFLSNMSHEIRTPINAIIGMNEMIKREAKDNDIREYAEIAGNSANALMSIINDILDFSRVESGKLQIVNEKYELYSLINDCFYMIRDRAKEKDLQVVVNCEPSLPAYLIGDMIRMRQVMVNLLTNAVKYTSIGTVSMTISGERNNDTINLRVDVSDTGIGMKQESLDKLFQKFERLDLEKNRNIEGTGLGLSIVNDLVALMNGTIKVQSEYGKGSTFTVIVPQKVEESEAIGNIEVGEIVINSDEQKYNPSFIAPDYNVLVVDDVQMNLLVFKKLVKDTKINVDTAISGQRCLEMIAKTKYDLIFMDHMMPEMDGVETFEEIRRREGHPNTKTPVVMLTANALVGMEQKYLELGFSDYIAKPIDVSKLEEILRFYIKEKKSGESGSNSDEKDTASLNNTSEVHDETAADNQTIDTKQSADSHDNTNETSATETAGDAHTDNETEGKDKEKKAMECRVDINKGIENCGGSKEFFIEVIEAYEEEGKREELIAAYEKEDWDLYTIAAHSLKGTMRLFGASDAGDMGEKLQFAGEAKDAATINNLHEQFVELIDASIAKIKEEVQ